MSKTDTRTKILDVAERLIAEKGIEATSLRSIVAEADVNLAAVNYHFGSKNGLVLEVFRRYIGPVNEARLQRLSELKTEHENKPIPIRELVKAFLLPALEMKLNSPEHQKQVMRLFGRIHIESNEIMHMIVGEFKTVFMQFVTEIRKTLPQLTLTEAGHRVRLMVGTMSAIMMGFPHLEQQEVPFMQALSHQEVIELAINFVTAGMKSKPVNKG